MPLTRPQFDAVAALALAAGRAILAHRDAPAAFKGDGSPVTAADLAADALICTGLSSIMPGWAVVSEERLGEAGQGRDLIFVDPLDGTREFVAGRDEFAVCIGGVRDGVPVWGVICAPALGALWRGKPGLAERWALGRDLELTGQRAIHVRPAPVPFTALVSRSHPDGESLALLDSLAPHVRHACGSGVKFGLIAEGSADLYPRFGPVMEWDAAAGHALVVAAGGSMSAPDGSPLRYGKAGYRCGPFIACGDGAVLNHAGTSPRPASR